MAHQPIQLKTHKLELNVFFSIEKHRLLDSLTVIVTGV